MSNLIICHYDLRCSHSGLEHMLSMIRERYWIVQVRVSLHQVLNGFFHCKWMWASVGQQKMANLHGRTEFAPLNLPSVNCFGPLLVCRGQSTCLAVRALHIKVSHGLDTNSFIYALRRFIARRGQPQCIQSHNGSNFVRCEKE